MSFSKSFVLFTMVSSLFITVSCKDYVGKEDSHPQYKSAIAAKEGKEYAKAAECFHDFLLICPKSARTHYELAVLCMDNLQDYESAIAHFRMYERLLDGNLSDKEIENIRKYIVLCKAKSFERYSKENNIKLASDMRISEEQYDSLENTMNLYKARLKDFASANADLKKQNDELKEKILEANKTINKVSTQIKANNKPVVSSTTKNDETMQQSEEGSNTYTVVKGDGLQLISKKVYGSSRYYKQIEEANRDVLGKKAILRVGQVLIIPELKQ